MLACSFPQSKIIRNLPSKWCYKYYSKYTGCLREWDGRQTTTSVQKTEFKSWGGSPFLFPCFYVASLRSQSVWKCSKIHIQSNLIQIWNTCVPLLLFERYKCWIKYMCAETCQQKCGRRVSKKTLVIENQILLLYDNNWRLEASLWIISDFPHFRLFQPVYGSCTLAFC